jgi:hypothetical protein
MSGSGVDNLAFVDEVKTQDQVLTKTAQADEEEGKNEEEIEEEGVPFIDGGKKT